MQNRTVQDLSQDGRKILFRSSADHARPPTRLCLLDLPTGRCDWFDLSTHFPGHTIAALSPDATEIAVFSWQNDRALADLIDIDSRTVIRLWTADDESWSSWESRVSWSPDGKLIATTIVWYDHEETDDDQHAVVVLSRADGSLVRRHDYARHLGWLNDRELGMFHHNSAPGDVVLADEVTGTTRLLPAPAWQARQSSGGPSGLLDDRVVIFRGFNDPLSAYSHIDRDGHDVRPLLTTRTWHPSILFAAATDPLRLGRPRG